jgi:Secretion system C-terminal sorting domain
MKYKTLLPGVFCLFTLSLAAQQSGSITGYAITASGKGERGWRQVRMIDMKTGVELKTVYAESAETEILNARSGKPVVKRDMEETPAKVVVYQQQYTVPQSAENKTMAYTRTIQVRQRKSGYDKPFATTSAACAYDKKHQRLYYTPMGIAQLRYIDLKAKKPTVYYFEDETFGAVTGMHDGGNQITRMVIASDGNGYALSNNGDHLVRFTTGKKPQITDLGSITDVAENGRYSIHSEGAYGGDMVAGASGSLYLLTASRHVFKINITEKTATHLGAIKGLPNRYQTNGAMVEEGMNIIVCSSESTEGYFRFNLETLQAEKISGSEIVFNASDLASDKLLADKNKTEEKETTPAPVPQEITAKTVPTIVPVITDKNINIFPNPVTGNEVKIFFNDLNAGKYMVQVTDMSGKLVTTSEMNIYGKNQFESFRLPATTGRGNYMVNVMQANASDEGGVKNIYTKQIVVQ